MAELVHLTNGSAVLLDTSCHKIVVDDLLFEQLVHWLAACKRSRRHVFSVHHESIEALEEAEFASLFALQTAMYRIATHLFYPFTPNQSATTLSWPLHCQLYQAILYAKLRQHPSLGYEVLASLVFNQHCVAPEAVDAPFDSHVNYRGYLVNALRMELWELFDEL
eukprot:m.295922 g.295922  ORF g.295922 m.295922 type:complete len:165 (-) comp63547_c0_seq1:328-822(-)